MRRVLMYLVLLPSAMHIASAQSVNRPVPKPIDLQFHRNEPSGGQQQQQQQQQFDNPCKATIPNGYPTLAVVPRTDAYLEYGGTWLTWTPNDNVTECHIRQIYFNVPDVMDNGTCPGENAVSPDINVELFHHGSDKKVKAAQNYDIVAEKNGPYILYRIDVQAPNKLKGDYDLHISIVGHPRPPPTTK